MEDKGLDLRHTLAMLWHERYIILASTIAVTLAAFVYSSSLPKTYTASSRVLIQPIPAEDADGGLSAALDPAVDTSIDTQAAIVESGAVAKRVSDALPSIDPDSYSVIAEPLTDNVVQVRVLSEVPRDAAIVANTYLEQYLALRGDAVRTAFERLAQDIDARVADLIQRIDEIKAELHSREGSGEQVNNAALRAERTELTALVGSLNGRMAQFQAAADSALAGRGGQIVQRAVAPKIPSSPKPARDAAVGFVLGALLGVGLCFLKEHLSRRVYTVDDAIRAARAPVLASVSAGGSRRRPRGRRRTGAVEPSQHPHPTPISSTGGSLVDQRTYEASRVLRSSLAAHGLGGSVRRLVVLSAEPGRDASSTVVGLGAACAAAEMQTIVVAGDLEDRDVDSSFGTRSSPGLTDILTSSEEVRDGLLEGLTKTSVDDLILLPGGTADPGARDPLASPRLALALQEIDRYADVVLIASPPLSAGADATLLAGQAEAAVLTVRMRSARASAVRHAAEQMEDLGVPLLGLVLLDVGWFDEGSEVTSRSRGSGHDQALGSSPPASAGDLRPGSETSATDEGSEPGLQPEAALRPEAEEADLSFRPEDEAGHPDPGTEAPSSHGPTEAARRRTSLQTLRGALVLTSPPEPEPEHEARDDLGFGNGSGRLEGPDAGKPT